MASSQYDNPKVRERLKKKIIAGTKGGKAGQWSARKAQLLAHEYEAAGGGYTGPRTASQKHLKKWAGEKWKTSDGKKAARAGGTPRYLPAKAWSKLTEAEKKSTNLKKQTGSKAGEQFVANTTKAKRAGRAARAK
jgi:hypothetical protein